MKECHIDKPKISFRWLICAILLLVVVSAILLCTSGKLVKNNMDIVHLLNIVVCAIFGLVHAIGMDIIDILLLFVAGTSVGIMFSLIVYESGSIWSIAIVHGIWNVIIIGEILDINISYNQHALFSYKLLSKLFILTGGAFGVEASIVAVV
ncbi:CPBP family glutamic-type intramembrane protease [Clostridium sp.]|uniref:CPBP family glutamic-type intramembrane protease n=1 Tax=Clostridium sp. TaxID=1506 RepID=UPI003D6CAAE3